MREIGPKTGEACVCVVCRSVSPVFLVGGAGEGEGEVCVQPRPKRVPRKSNHEH